VLQKKPASPKLKDFVKRKRKDSDMRRLKD
jgi:hypothetical protein